MHDPFILQGIAQQGQNGYDTANTHKTIIEDYGWDLAFLLMCETFVRPVTTTARHTGCTP